MWYCVHGKEVAAMEASHRAGGHKASTVSYVLQRCVCVHLQTVRAVWPPQMVITTFLIFLLSWDYFFLFFLDGINACSILKFNNYSIPQHNFMLSWCRLLMWYVALENKTGFYYFEQFSLVQHDKCKDAGTLAASFLRNTQVIYWKKCLVRKISKHHFNQFVWNIFFYILFLIITHER